MERVSRIYFHGGQVRLTLCVGRIERSEEALAVRFSLIGRAREHT